MSNINTEETVEAYIAIRTERDRLRSEYEESDGKLKADLAQLEAVLLSVCNEVHADSIKTGHGTVIRQLKERFYPTDWDSFKAFVLEHKAVDLFERRVHQTNMKQFLFEHPDDGLPPGLNVMREYAISVRKPSSQE